MFPIDANLLSPIEAQSLCPEYKGIGESAALREDTHPAFRVGGNIEIRIESAVRVEHADAVGSDKPDGGGS